MKDTNQDNKQDSQLESLSLDDLSGVSGGGWKGKAVKKAWEGMKWVGRKFGDGVGDGIKTSGKVVTAGGVTEGGSRALEGATGVRTPRPSDVIRK